MGLTFPLISPEEKDEVEHIPTWTGRWVCSCEIVLNEPLWLYFEAPSTLAGPCLLLDRRGETALLKAQSRGGQVCSPSGGDYSLCDKTISFSPCWSNMQWSGVKIIHTILCSWTVSKPQRPSCEYYFYRFFFLIFSLPPNCSSWWRKTSRDSLFLPAAGSEVRLVIFPTFFLSFGLNPQMWCFK